MATDRRSISLVNGGRPGKRTESCDAGISPGSVPAVSADFCVRPSRIAPKIKDVAALAIGVAMPGSSDAAGEARTD